MIRRFEDLIAWQKGRQLASAVYKERDQICSAAVSVPSNIAEGFERNRLREFVQFLSYAKASCAEVRTQVYVAFDVGYLNETRLADFLAQTEEVSRIIGALRRSIAKKLGTRH